MRLPDRQIRLEAIPAQMWVPKVIQDQEVQHQGQPVTHVLPQIMQNRGL